MRNISIKHENFCNFIAPISKLAATLKYRDSAKINEQTDDKKAHRTKWHIWFFPTHEPTLKKPKEPFSCQRFDTVQTEKLILTD